MTLPIKTAYETMLRTLSPQERPMVTDILGFDDYLERIATAWRRAPILNLADDIASIVDSAKKGAVKKGDCHLRRIKLYCDTLVIPPGYEIALTEKSGVIINIYARSVHYDSSADVAFEMKLTPGAEIAFYTNSLPKGFKARLNTVGGESIVQDLFIEDDKFGVAATYDPKEQKTPKIVQRGFPSVEMDYIDYLARLNPDGTLTKSDVVINENLPRLLYFQFLVATSYLHYDADFALELLRYIWTATRRSKKTAEFNLQVSALLSSTLAQVTKTVSYVPTVNVHSSKKVLQARLLAAKSFEDRFYDFLSQSKQAEHVSSSALIMFESSQDALSEYRFLQNQAQKQYETADAVYAQASDAFRKRQEELTKASSLFQEGVEEWKLGQEKQAVKEILFAIFEVGAAIGATVLTAGLAAPAAIGAVSSAVNSASKIAKLWATLKRVFDKVKEIYEKIKPALEKLKVLADAIKSLVVALKHADAMAEMPGKMIPASSSDGINGSAEWDEFAVEVDLMFETLEEYDIKGKNEYKKALKFLPIRGKAFLQAQRALITTGEKLVTATLKCRLQERQEVRVRGAVENIGTDVVLLDIFKRAMFDRLLAVRAMVFLDFWSYTAAYMYHSLALSSPVALSATKPIFDYADDAARLQGAMGSFAASVKVQRKLFRLQTLAGFSNPAQLRSQLENNGSLKFTVDWNSDLFRQFCRVRLQKMRCYLEGVKPKSEVNGETLQLILRTGTQFTDRDLPHTIQLGSGVDDIDADETFDTPRSMINTVGKPRAFVSGSRYLLFEHDPKTGEILCDGEFSQEENYTRLTPFTEWKIELGKDGIKLEDLDLEGFSAVRLELWCDVTLTKTVE